MAKDREEKPQPDAERHHAVRAVVVADARETLAELAARGERFGVCITDPPYGLGLHSITWDSPEAQVAHDPVFWRAVLAVLSPGAFLVAFTAPRTYHRLAAAVEAAGFAVRPPLVWHAGNGLPAAIPVAELLDRRLAPERRVLGARPAAGRALANARLGAQARHTVQFAMRRRGVSPEAKDALGLYLGGNPLRPDAEFVLLAQAPLDGTALDTFLLHGTGAVDVGSHRRQHGGAWPSSVIPARRVRGRERMDAAGHPAAKPVALMEDLCRLFAPRGARVLDPFAGAGSTGVAAARLGIGCLLIERDPEMAAVAERRVSARAVGGMTSNSASQVMDQKRLDTASRVTPEAIRMRQRTLATEAAEREEHRHAVGRTRTAGWRGRLADRGLREAQVWCIDVTSADRAVEVRRQAEVVAASLRPQHDGTTRSDDDGGKA